MVLAFYRATTGRVLLDGIDVRALNLRTLREQIGVVSQDNVLVGGSIRDNIRYGRLNAGQAEIEAAARLANAHDFISSLPEGYNTEIGDRGVRMSGGQKQRIAIARAILKNPRILILDEATSALDSESEKAVQEAMESLRKDRTSFIIAHRLSTVRNADRIMVMRQGRIVESGTFDELIQRGGEFFRYYRIQFARENEDAPHSATA
jgi:subfamily B ATP-binding cassette protein MsbA